MRILCDVVLEPRLAQQARRELRVERHGADRLVDRGVALPGFAREEIPAHGRRSLEPTKYSTTCRKHGGPGSSDTRQSGQWLACQTAPKGPFERKRVSQQV